MGYGFQGQGQPSRPPPGPLDIAIALGVVAALVGLPFGLLGGLHAYLGAFVGLGLCWGAVMMVPDRGGWYRLLQGLLMVVALIVGLSVYLALETK